MTDIINGGLADNKTLEDICNKHRCNLEDLNQQLLIGLKVEKEHTDNPGIAKEIAMDHLWEDPKYYTKLKKVEESMKLMTLLKESDSLFKIKPALAYEIYDILKKEVPEITKKCPNSNSFFYLINDKLK